MGPPHFRNYKDAVSTTITYSGQTNSNMLNVKLLNILSVKNAFYHFF